ncbi:OadG family protein [Aliikangiella sp. IMCC44359]|uniref:OadG family protein n=1 Tax=Aliikangiella sp. IMCC44359 TaxID=3459125 RepID=UPI00403ADD43
MNESNIISDGFLLMLTGMGTVFIFLSILVFFTGLLQRFAKEEVIKQTSNKQCKYDEDEIAAVSAAVYAYRQKIINSEE